MKLGKIEITEEDKRAIDHFRKVYEIPEEISDEQLMHNIGNTLSFASIRLHHACFDFGTALIAAWKQLQKDFLKLRGK